MVFISTTFAPVSSSFFSFMVSIKPICHCDYFPTSVECSHFKILFSFYTHPFECSFLFSLLILHIVVFISWMSTSFFPPQPWPSAHLWWNSFSLFFPFSFIIVLLLCVFLFCTELPLLKWVLSISFALNRSVPCLFLHILFLEFFFLMWLFLHLKSIDLFPIILFWIVMKHSKFILIDIISFFLFELALFSD